MRGYFSIGVEGISKPMNLGTLMRSAHAFNASFCFSLDVSKRLKTTLADTANSFEHLPYYDWATVDDMVLPKGCQLVGIELTDDAIELPSFRHPPRAAYVLGRERGSLSPALMERCDHIVKIPTLFCVNVAIAGSIVMYDRIRTLGRFAPRPTKSGGPDLENLGEPPQIFGAVKQRTKSRDF